VQMNEMWTNIIIPNHYQILHCIYRDTFISGDKLLDVINNCHMSEV
jgi:hypothetical protein